MAEPQALATTTANTTPGSRTVATATTLFTRSIDSSGWLKIRLEPTGEFQFVCDFTKVAVSREAGGRVFFLCLEGPHKGKQASLSLSNKSVCLHASKRGSGAILSVRTIERKATRLGVRTETFNQLLATLSFNGNTVAITLDSDIPYTETNRMSPLFGQRRQSKPLPPGTYKILTPSHAGDPNATAFYADPRIPGSHPALKHHTVWFPIEYAPNHNSNFIHVGNLSEGCVTIYELEKWAALYAYLISNRSDRDGKYIGSITIT